jgi:hypothetical protein
MILTFDGLSPERLIKDDRLENFHRMMEYGCFGQLDFGEYGSQSITAFHSFCLQAIRQGKRAIMAGAIPESLANDADGILYKVQGSFEGDIGNIIGSQFATIDDRLSEGNWDIIFLSGISQQLIHNSQFREFNPGDFLAEYQYSLDLQLGNTLKLINDNFVILVVSTSVFSPDLLGSFILAGSNNPINGELKGVKLNDLIVTLCDFGGLDKLEDMPGTSLVAGVSLEDISSGELTEEEEAILRERLSGLGYIS